MSALSITIQCGFTLNVVVLSGMLSRYGWCLKCAMLSVIMLSSIILSVTLPSVVPISALMLNVIVPCVVKQSVVAPFKL